MAREVHLMSLVSLGSTCKDGVKAADYELKNNFEISVIVYNLF